MSFSLYYAFILDKKHVQYSGSLLHSNVSTLVGTFVRGGVGSIVDDIPLGW